MIQASRARTGATLLPLFRRALRRLVLRELRLGGLDIAGILLYGNRAEESKNKRHAVEAFFA